MFLSRVLDDGLSSRLQRAMCERKGLLYNISCGIESFTDISLFDIEFTVSAGKLAEVTGLVAAELERLKKERMSRDEFEMVRDRFMRDIYSNAENPRSMANLLAEAFLLKLPFPIEPNEADGFLKYLTPKIIQDEAKRCFDFSKTMFVCKGRVPAAQRKATERVLNRYSKKS
jgi:predicted Zn-dependent peptidase